MAKRKEEIWSQGFSEQLCGALLACRNTAELKAFLRDLLTEEEIREFSLRFETARLLADEVPYSQIQAITGFSTTTIARVSKWMKQGSGGYKNVIERLARRVKGK